jgi:dTDP-4-amino-4,6-dideoxygalactose transaminase
MQFIDLGRQYERIRNDVAAAIEMVLEGQRFIMGPEVAELEERLAAFVGARHALGVSSGTDALVVLLMAYGVGPGDAIFVPSFTFFATAECVSVLGATPVFVDVDETTFNLDAASLEQAVERIQSEDSLRPRGVIPVDLFGLPADYDAIRQVADRHGLFVLEDAAQGFGGAYHGRRAGSLGNCAATSFFPAKPLGCYGDGGAVFMDSTELWELCASLRVHGQGADRYDNVRIGMNGRLDTLQAAILLAKLRVFEDELVARNRVAASYTEHLAGSLQTPVVPDGLLSAWAQYTLTVNDEALRDTLVAHLKEQGIPTMIYYPTPLHLLAVYRDLGYERGSLPVSEHLSKTVFSIPMHPYLSEQEIEMIAAAIREIAR